MACEINIPKEEEYQNLVKQLARPYKVSPYQEQGVTIMYLEDTQIKWKLVDDITGKKSERYTLLGSDIQMRFRVTDEISDKFEKRMGKVVAEQIRNSVTSQKAIEMGNLVHKANEVVMKALIAGESLAPIEKKLAAEFKNDTAAKNLVKGITDIYNQIQAKQKDINPEGNVIIKVEQTIIDPKSNKGGSIDVLAIYSDNTASIFDYKTREARGWQVERGGKLKQSLVYEGKREDYRLQLVEYKRILQEVYGLKDVRQARIVPIRAEFKKKYEKNKAPQYLEGVSRIEMGGNSSQFLRQFPVLPEKTKYKGVNEYMAAKLQQIDILKQKRRKLKTKAEKDRITAKITAINKLIQDVLVSQDLSTIGTDIGMTIRYLQENIDKIDDVGELKEYKDEMEYYSNIANTFGTYLTAVKNSGNKEKYVSLRELLGAISFEAGVMKEQLEETILDKMKTLIGEEHFDEFNKVQAKKLGFWDKASARLSEIDHPIFKAFKKIKDQAYYDMRRESIDFYKKINEINGAFKQWAKDNNLSENQAVEKLINKEKGNFYSRYNTEFFNARDKAKAEKDINFVKEYLKLNKSEEEITAIIDEEREAYKETVKKQKNNFNPIEFGGKVVKTTQELRKEYNDALKSWELKNNFLVKNSKGEYTNLEAVFNAYNLQTFFEIDPEKAKKFESNEYKYIQNNKPLADYYNFIVESNNNFRDMLGVNFSELPTNFFANVRKDLLQKVTSNGIAGFSKGFGEILDSLQVREEDIFLGVRDLNTGELQRNIPIMFLNPFKKEDGMQKEKSYDIMHSTMLFAKMAYNYKYMSSIEAQSLALKDILSERTEATEVTSEGKAVKNKFLDTIKTKTSIVDGEIQHFNKILDYYLYGIRFSEKGTPINVLGKKLNSTKLLLATKHLFANKTLAFAAIPAAAAFMHGKVGAYVEGKKGVFYNSEQWRKGMGYIARNLNDSMKLARDLDIFTEDELSRLIHESQAGTRKLFDSRTMHAFLRTADEGIDLGVMMGMLQNYGLDENGNVKRIERLPEGTPPLFDIENKKLVELTDAQKIQVRNSIKKVAIKIKGAMSDDDISMMNTNLTLNILMQFKTWMPGVLNERFGREKFDEELDAFEVGRFTALYKDFNFDPDLAFTQWFGKVFAPKLGALAIELSTFGIATPFTKMKNGKVNWGAFSASQKARIEARYNAFIANNSHLKDTLTLDEFVLGNQRAIKAALWEARIIMVLGAITSILGAGGEGEKPYYARFGWAGRTLYKILNRGAAEISFTLNPHEFINMVRNPLPLAKILVDVMNTAENTADETRDLVFGENSPNDRTPALYYTSRWVPGVNQARKVFDFIYEEDKKNTY